VFPLLSLLPLQVPQPRSLLTYEEGLVTLRLVAAPGVIDGWQTLQSTLKNLLKKAGVDKVRPACW
jgi:hypothetical protein